MASATTHFKTANVLKLALPMTFILGIGTGGDGTPNYIRTRAEKLVVGPSRADSTGNTSIDVISAAADLGRIKSILKISTIDLADTLGVSRQTVHNWKAGSHIKPDNLSKLENLSRAATEIARAGITMSPLVLNRKLSDGSTLLQRIAQGKDGAESAVELVNILRSEMEQRAALDKLLAGNAISGPAEYGVPSVRGNG